MTAWASLSDDEVIERFARVTQWARKGERAPHKPLLILWMLSRLLRGEGRVAAFAEVEKPLTDLLREFGPPRKVYHPAHPFWHLQSDGLWVVPEAAEVERSLPNSGRRITPWRALLIGAHGEIPERLAARLLANPDLVHRISQRLIDDNFPRSVHEELLDAIGMPWIQAGARATRSAAFRDTILRIYEHRCAICGYDGRLEHSHLGLEAAHVRWHAAGGPASPDNGLALCVFHHKAFDRGALGLTDDHRVLVSQHIHGSQGVDEWLRRFSGGQLRPPQPGCERPAPYHLEWHRREVFRDPPRPV